MATPSSQHTQAADQFEDLLTGVLGKAYGYALRLTSNPADAEDLIQEAALRALRFFESFTHGTNFKAWFFRILTNCYYQTGRSASRRVSTVEYDDVPELYMFAKSSQAGLYDRGPDPATELIAGMGIEQITDALESLPEEYRVVATLFFLEDFSYPEIAGIIDCPIGTVRSRLHRGRRLLQKVLWQTAVDCGIVAALQEGAG